MPMGKIKGAHALVCGATSGLGLQIARGLAARGAESVLLIARDAKRMQLVNAELASEYPEVQFSVRVCDMSSDSQVASLAASMASVDLVVQAVGASDRGKLCDLSLERLEELQRVNVYPAINAVRYLAPRLQLRGGTLVLVGSLASIFAPRFLGGYAVVKHSVAAIAQQARLELAESGVRVMLVCPGPIRRKDAGQRYSDSGSGLPPGALQPGGGAKIKGLDPQRLVEDILSGVEANKLEIIRPRKARLLAILAAISPRLGDWLLRKQSS